MRICFIPAFPDKTAQSLLKTFAEFEIVFSRKIELPGKNISRNLPKKLYSYTFSVYIGKLADGIKIVYVKDFFCGGVVRFTNHHYFLTIHNKSVVL